MSRKTHLKDNYFENEGILVPVTLLSRYSLIKVGLLSIFHTESEGQLVFNVKQQRL